MDAPGARQAVVLERFTGFDHRLTLTEALPDHRMGRLSRKSGGMGHPEVGGASCLAKHESRTCFFSVSTGVADPQGDETGFVSFQKAA